MVSTNYLAAMADGVDRPFKPEDVTRICEMLFTAAAEGLVVVDAAGVILMHNPRLNAMFGYEPDELVGKGIEMLLPDAAQHARSASVSDDLIRLHAPSFPRAVVELLEKN